MIKTASYEVLLYLNGTLIGDCRSFAEGLSYTRRRTKMGADSIEFTVNDKLLNDWCVVRGTSIVEILKPLALECRLVRDGEDIVGGFLATMPAYHPLNASAHLHLVFDGYLNLLEGVYIRDTSTNLPLGQISGEAGALFSSMISLANSISSNAGKSYGFSAGHVDVFNSITHTFDNYKTVKGWLCDRCDNLTGAGPFDVYFHADKTYDIYKDENFGHKDKDWVAFYPMLQNNTSATSISASEVGGFSSAVLGLGSGEVSSNADENTALIQFISDNSVVQEYGYFEDFYQESSISTAGVLLRNMNARLANNSNPIWQPEISLHGIQVAPKPTGDKRIWIGDTITVQNSMDLTGMTSGKFRVNELRVAVSATGDEVITPTLERVADE